MWYTDVECYARFEVADAPPEGLSLFSWKSRTNSVKKSRFRTLILQGCMCVEKKILPQQGGKKGLCHDYNENIWQVNASKWTLTKSTGWKVYLPLATHSINFSRHWTPRKVLMTPCISAWQVLDNTWKSKFSSAFHNFHKQCTARWWQVYWGQITMYGRHVNKIVGTPHLY